jgi:hypothetical protein
MFKTQQNFKKWDLVLTTQSDGAHFQQNKERFPMNMFKTQQNFRGAPSSSLSATGQFDKSSLLKTNSTAETDFQNKQHPQQPTTTKFLIKHKAQKPYISYFMLHAPSPHAARLFKYI